MPSRIFLVKEPSDCEPINALCEKLDKTKEDYEISYDDEQVSITVMVMLLRLIGNY